MLKNENNECQRVVGVIEVTHADSSGKILHKYKRANAIDNLNHQIAGGLYNGKPVNGTGAVSAGLREFYDGGQGFVTTNTDYQSEARSRGGIAVWNSAVGIYSNGTLLACTTVSGATNLNYFQVSGSCSFNAATTAQLFALLGGGTNASLSPGWNTLSGKIESDAGLCNHVVTFAYSSGDTLTVNWAATVTS